MRNLLLVPYPADEVLIYGGLLTAQQDSEQTWNALLAFDRRPNAPALHNIDLESVPQSLGIASTKKLNLPVVDQELIDVADAILMMKHELEGYDRVYIPDATSGNMEGLLTTMAAICVEGEIWTRTNNGQATCVYTPDGTGLAHLVEYLNTNYQIYLRHQAIDIAQIQNAFAFRAVNGKAIVRFNLQCGRHTGSLSQYFETLSRDDPDPWDLSTSPYERRRHELELKMIADLEWSSIAEVGACCGVFTKLLAKHFPDRRIVAIEPTAAFAERIRAEKLPNVEILSVPVQQVEEKFSLVLLSSCIYYMAQWPAKIIRNAEKYVVTSHRWTYEQEVVYPAMKSSGWLCARELELPPAIETFSNFLIDKDGTLITLWVRK